MLNTLLKQVCLTTKDMVMETTNDDYWKDFMVEGQRVRTISKDAKIMLKQLFFSICEGKTVYDAIVKLSMKQISMMDNTMSESLIKTLQKPIPINLTKKEQQDNSAKKEATPATPSKPTPSPVEKESQKQDSQKDDNKQLPSVEKENDASSESGKDKTPVRKPTKGEDESDDQLQLR